MRLNILSNALRRTTKAYYFYIYLSINVFTQHDRVIELLQYDRNRKFGNVPER